MQQLAPAYEKETGNHLTLVLGPSMGVAPTAIPVRLARGEKADLVILARSGLDGLIAKGLVALPATDLVRSRIAMAVKAGAPAPDISTLAAFKRTLLAAKSVAYSDSASGVYIETEMYKKLGIEEQMAKKSRKIQATPVGLNVARGEVEIGFQQMAELKPIPGIKIVGYLLEGRTGEPHLFLRRHCEVHHHNQTGAKALLAWPASPGRYAIICATGLTPAAQATGK